MRFFTQLILTCGFLTLCLFSAAQPGTEVKTFKADIKRQLFHDYVDREQKAALAADGKPDELFRASEDEEINYLVTNALVNGVDRLQQDIEKDTISGHAKKVAYIRGMENLLKNFTARFKKTQLNASNLPVALNVYEKAMVQDREGGSVEPLISRMNYEVGSLVLGSNAFDGNKGYKEARYSLIRKYAAAHPQGIFPLLKDNDDVPFRDSLIRVGAYKSPRLLYDYAAANNKLGYAIRKIDDPLVQTVSKMATSGGSGQIYFAFLDNILKGRMSLQDIDAVKNDDVKFYRLLVQTRIDYMKRLQQKDTVYELAALTEMLRKRATDVFIKEINARHEEPDARRFQILQQLTPQELYYLIVSSENEIYTSSYVRGVFPVMMQKIGNRGDSLLMTVGFDRFKKFIKIAAGYNTLNAFLRSFPSADQSRTLMTAFVSGLEKTGTLEDGVDVADSYVSIAEGNKELAQYVLDLTRWNYDKNIAQGNQRGMLIYNLLHKLFLSADTTNNVNLSQEFGIPPVYNVPFSSLTNDKQEVVMQVFFYGDDDGRNIFQGFLRQFGGSNWRITYADKWVQITSVRGKPIFIFANKPLPEETGQDEEAQDALTEYLRQKGLQPSIIIHRGHSYYANSTIEHITPSAKIVFMGSCGGYHLIHDVLAHSPDAHIIASKQIGMTRINQPFFNLLMEKMRNGNNIDWIPFWNDFKRTTGPVEGFEDYIPPHKNLGAIFIKAYRTAMGNEEE